MLGTLLEQCSRTEQRYQKRLHLASNRCILAMDLGMVKDVVEQVQKMQTLSFLRWLRFSIASRSEAVGRHSKGATEARKVFTQSRESSCRMCNIFKNPSFAFLCPTFSHGIERAGGV